MLPSREIDLLREYATVDDPFAFLVVEQVLRQKERSRFPQHTPVQLIRSQRARNENARAVRSYQRFCEQCDFLWLQLVRRLMELQIEETMFPFEKQFERKQRYEQHVDDLKELHYQQEIIIEQLRLQGLLNPLVEEAHRRKMAEIEMEQAQLNLSHEHETGRVRQTNTALLEYQRSQLQTIADIDLKPTRKHEETLARLQTEAQERLQTLAQAHDYVMNAGKPDKDDKVYLAKQGKEVFDVYIEMIRERWKAAEMDESDQYHLEVKMLTDMLLKLI